MKSVNIHEAKTNLSAIISDIEKGETYLICRNGVPVAEIVSHRKKKRSLAHPVFSDMAIHYDPTEELSESEWGEIE